MLLSLSSIEIVSIYSIFRRSFIWMSPSFQGDIQIALSAMFTCPITSTIFLF